MEAPPQVTFEKIICYDSLLQVPFPSSQFHVTFWAGMSGFLHVIHAEGDKAARPTSNEAKNHCNQELQIKDLEIPNSDKVDHL